MATEQPLDCFALLNEQRRPWLDPESLKQKFFGLSAQFHPDRVHNASETEKAAAQERYTSLNAAYNRLRDLKQRLLHLLELERGHKPSEVQNIPAGLIPLFSEVNRTCRRAAAVLQEMRQAGSPLLKVQMFERGQECSEQLLSLQAKLNVEQAKLMSEIREIDSEWNENENHEPQLRRLEEIYRLLSYFGRWSAQLQEQIAQFATASATF